MTQPAETLRGRFGRILKQDEDRVFALFTDEAGRVHRVSARATSEDLRAREVTLTGHMAPSERGPVFRASGVWRGAAADLAPPPLDGVVAVLVALVKGVGPALAARLAAQLRTTLWDAVTKEPFALVPIAGREKAYAIQRTLLAHGLPQVSALAHLMALRLTLPYARRALEELGTDAIEQLRADPYRLMRIKGVRFATADAIARKRFGVALHDRRRLTALAVSVLEDAASNGHTSLAHDVAVAEVERLGELAHAGLSAADVFEQAVEARAVVDDLGDYYLPGLHHAECRAADGIAAISLRAPRPLPLSVEQDPALAKYDARQRRAIALGLTAPIVFVYGRPGTGKTTIEREIVRYAQELGIPVTLAATTANAADRLTDAVTAATPLSGAMLRHPVEKARTIQSLAGNHGTGRALPPGIVIIDEFSMADLPLFARILDNCGPETTLVLCGDPNQLPSVVAGNTSRDLRDAAVVAKVELTEVHRQARHTLVSINAERVLRGLPPLYHGRDITEQHLREAGIEDLAPEGVATNCYAMSARTPVSGASKVVDAVRRLRDKDGLRRDGRPGGYDPIREMQVYAPKKLGFLGTLNLNRCLQAELNPAAAETALSALGPLGAQADPAGDPRSGLAIKRMDVVSLPVAPPVRAGEPLPTYPRGHVLQVGDPVKLVNGHAARGLRPGATGEVVQVDADGTVTVRVERITVAYAAEQVSEALRTAFPLVLRVGDPVLHTRNAKGRRTVDGGRIDLANGMRGLVVARTADGGAIIEFKGVRVPYAPAQLTDLILGYASTVHRGQGQETPVAILALHQGEHFTMLDQSLFYVALTRAKDHFVRVGTDTAERIALRQALGAQRRTRLAERTRERLAARQAESGWGAPLLAERTAAILSQALARATHAPLDRDGTAVAPDVPPPAVRPTRRRSGLA